MDSTKLINKNPILVTGASGIIGKELVKNLVRDNKKVIALTRDLKKIESFSEDVTKIEIDLNDKDISHKIDEIIKNHGPLSGFVHCAGFDKLSPLYLNKADVMESLFSIHVFSALKIISILSKKDRMVKNSSIVLISSLSTHEGASGHTLYASAKGAIEGFIKSAASELSRKKIRINVIIPGVIKSKMSDGFIEKLDNEQFQSLIKSYPLGLGEPKDVSNLILFLLSNKSSWITGQKIIIDGGHSSRSV